MTPLGLEAWLAELNQDYRALDLSLAGSSIAAETVASILDLATERERADFLGAKLDYGQGEATELAADLASWLGLSSDQVLLTSGASEAIFLLQELLAGPGDVLVVENPGYQPLYQPALDRGAIIREVVLAASDAWALPLRQLGSAIKGAALVGLNRPHNPTGAGMTGVQLRAVLAMCEQEGTRLISDEVYRDLAKRAAPPAALLNERAVTVGGISKPFGLGGLRLGWLATQDTTLLAALRRLRDYITLMPSGAAQRLGSIAIRHRQPLLERASLLRDRNAALLDEFLRCHHGRLRAVAPEAGCTAFVEALGVTDTKAFSRAAARQAGVLLLPGELFGRPGFVRMGFGSSTFEFGRALDKLDGWLARRAAVGDNGGSQDDQL